MDVIDLLIDHPAAPQRLGFETILPHLMKKFEIFTQLHPS